MRDQYFICTLLSYVLCRKIKVGVREWYINNIAYEIDEYQTTEWTPKASPVKVNVWIERQNIWWLNVLHIQFQYSKKRKNRQKNESKNYSSSIPSQSSSWEENTALFRCSICYNENFLCAYKLRIQRFARCLCNCLVNAKQTWTFPKSLIVKNVGVTGKSDDS